MTAKKFSVGQAVVLVKPFAYRKFSERYENIPKGTVGFVVHTHSGDKKSEPYCFVMFGEHGSHNVSYCAIDPYLEEPKKVVLYNEAKGCLYGVEIIAETEKSYFAGHSGNECVYLKSNWVILEGGFDIVQMMNATGNCIRIEDAITLYKAGFRRVEV